MRFNAFRGTIKESDWFELPFQDGIRFHINRKGVPGFMKRARETQKQFMGTFKETLAEKGITLGDVRGGDVDFEKLTDEVPLAKLEFENFMGGGDFDGIARFLVRDVLGPLILEDDSDDVIPWRREDKGVMAGTAFLENYPDIAKWVLEKAGELEDDYQTLMEASVKNSPSSSEPAAEDGEASA